MSCEPTEYDSDLMYEKILLYKGRNFRYFSAARKVSTFSSSGEYRHGAVLVNGSAIVNSSSNKNRLCSFGTRFRGENAGIATLHAELGCILGIDRSITEGARVYVCRVGKNGDFRLSKPCPMCTAAMKYVGIKRVYWTIDNNNCAMGRL